MSLLNLVKSHIKAWSDEVNHRPVIIGLNGPQGSGKTTLSETLSNDSEILAFSLDDFYYNHNNLLRIADMNRGNPFLKFRGCPGTHDLPLLTSISYELLMIRRFR